MTVRWTVRTANDRGALRTENRVLFEAPKEKDHSPSGLFSCRLDYHVFFSFVNDSFKRGGREITGQTQKYILYCIYRYGR